jgi:hypothetical protein
MITSEEQIDLFLSLNTLDLMDLLKEIKDKLDFSGTPILNNLQNDYNNDFVELILEHVDLKKFYLNYYK